MFFTSPVVINVLVVRGSLLFSVVVSVMVVVVFAVAAVVIPLVVVIIFLITRIFQDLVKTWPLIYDLRDLLLVP